MSIVEEIQKELRDNVDLKYKGDSKRFFKENVELLGIRTPVVRKISRKYFDKIKKLDKKEIFLICEKLLELGYETKTIAFDWAFRLKSKYKKEDFKIFERWLNKYVSNWATCDDFCTHALGNFIFQFHEFLDELNKWAKSDNRWVRRATSVTLIYSVRKGKYLDKAFEIADILLSDKDDLVQKGYGWMLKEASNYNLSEVFAYVKKHKNEMPRTALRYAIEKMPPNYRKIAMGRT